MPKVSPRLSLKSEQIVETGTDLKCPNGLDSSVDITGSLAPSQPGAVIHVPGLSNIPKIWEKNNPDTGRGYRGVHQQSIVLC